ncbi:uncharacterized protein E5676_scaffold2119G00700 [Cucumis melo var. makuwa]|uniref:Uncharacterized protein n=1 Tax=Cucumis melo var. makuwa TaxID=1194695 RepID=A0A5D3BYM9_CUCMM|nr:uncharacterized protein E6C27_scaffold498G00070 [Cucumis melo var. makuwa]TYK04128.1 uncharacterized protein E5676_scaffold2119G00700 [Cucumis melo var. makuwa]
MELHSRSPRSKKRSSNEKQNSGCVHVSESATTSNSQSTDSTASQSKTPTLGAIAQSDMSLMRMFGTARRCRGLYILDDDSSVIIGRNSRTTTLAKSYTSRGLFTKARAPTLLNKVGWSSEKLSSSGSRKYFITVDVTVGKDQILFPVSHLRGGECE